MNTGRVAAVNLRGRSLTCAVLSIFLGACAPVRLVSNYDEDAAKAIVATSEETLAFYDQMITAGADQLSKLPKPADCHKVVIPYSPYKDRWSQIETKLRVMVVREESRPLNAESARMAKNILSEWEEKRAMHLAFNDYRPDPGDCSGTLLRNHRNRFQQYFTAALVAEKAKLIADPQADPRIPRQ